jgi:hypothetical protein
MLAEFALTPSIFDETAHADLDAWRDQIRTLIGEMFPKNGAHKVMVANYYSGVWETRAKQLVTSISNQKARIDCELFLTKIKEMAVIRPACQHRWPSTAIAWGQEAIASHSVESLDRIITSHSVHAALSPDCHVVKCINEVEHEEFWAGVSSSWPQTMKISDQILALRKLCIHSEFICLITPHIYGGSDDETDFAIELIRSAFRRPDGYSTAEVEIHTETPDKQASADFQQRLLNQTHNISGALQSARVSGQKIRLVLWPKLLERYVIAGVYAELADGKRCRSPRWGISTPHIARKLDERDPKPPAQWSLLSKSQLRGEFERYCKDGVTGFTKSDDVHL